MQKVPVKIWTEFIHSHGMPKYETAGAAGMDVRSNARVIVTGKQIGRAHV